MILRECILILYQKMPIYLFRRQKRSFQFILQVSSPHSYIDIQHLSNNHQPGFIDIQIIHSQRNNDATYKIIYDSAEKKVIYTPPDESANAQAPPFKPPFPKLTINSLTLKLLEAPSTQYLMSTILPLTG
jgi:hypothetical protein